MVKSREQWTDENQIETVSPPIKEAIPNSDEIDDENNENKCPLVKTTNLFSWADVVKKDQDKKAFSPDHGGC